MAPEIIRKLAKIFAVSPRKQRTRTELKPPFRRIARLDYLVSGILRTQHITDGAGDVLEKGRHERWTAHGLKRLLERFSRELHARNVADSAVKLYVGHRKHGRKARLRGYGVEDGALVAALAMFTRLRTCKEDAELRLDILYFKRDIFS
eukprot:scaffold1006_cov270-Pinguiococcus_pyrenoidosus.AAC.29